MSDLDDDLRDVFRSLYDGEEWDDWADDIEAFDQAAVQAAPGRYTKAYLRAALAALLSPTPANSAPSSAGGGGTKRKHIYPPPTPAAGFLPSTAPLPPVNMHAYAPFSPLPLLAMLRTYTPRTWSALLPKELSPVALAGAGWVNVARDGVACATAGGGSSVCSAAWGVGGLDGIKDARVRAEVVRRLAAGLSRRHDPGCGWRVRACPPTLVDQLRRYVHPLVASSLAPLARALHVRSLGPEPPKWSSPLSEAQLDALAATLTRHDSTSPAAAPFGHLEVALALFGWYPHDPAAPAESDHVAHTSAPGDASKTDIVACRLCLRRVGLWMFASSENEKRFDVHKEHLWWCPLVVEGWWACPLLETPAAMASVPRIGERPVKRWKGKGRMSAGEMPETPSSSALAASASASTPTASASSAPALVMV